MTLTNLTKTLIISSLLGLSALFTACQSGGATVMSNTNKTAVAPTIAATATPTAPTSKGPGDVKYDAAGIKEVSLETVYKEFYAEGDKCRKDYVEYFGKDDGAASSSSPCRIKIVLNRDTLKATRTIDVWRWDKTERRNSLVEKTTRNSEISAEKFAQIAKLIGENEAFTNWQDMSINVSNCTITAFYPQGARSVMSNVGPTTVDYLPMVIAFRDFDRETKWQEAK
jgi:hypothetical protein